MNSGRNRGIVGSVMLLITAMIWGAAFVAQSEGMEFVGPGTFNFARMLIGGIVLIPAIIVFDRIGLCSRPKSKAEWKTLLLGGLCCGTVLAVASMMQQIGIMYTSPGKAGFITSLYIVLIPIFEIILGRKNHWSVWLAVAVAAVGMYFLCINGSFALGTGDICVIICAFLFACHIMVIDRFAPKTDGVRLSGLQFIVAGLLCGIYMLIFEEPSIQSLLDAKLSILYTGVCSSGIGYTLQTVAQTKVRPVIASLLMSLESVFSVVFSWIILGDRLSGRELLGCALIFAAVISAQLIPELGKKKVND